MRVDELFALSYGELFRLLSSFNSIIAKVQDLASMPAVVHSGNIKTRLWKLNGLMHSTSPLLVRGILRFNANFISTSITQSLIYPSAKQI